MNCTCTIEDTFSNNNCPACLEYYFATFNTFDPPCLHKIKIKVKAPTKSPTKITLYKSTKFKGVVDISTFWNPFIAKALIKFPSLKFESVDNAYGIDSSVISYPTLRLFFDDNSHVDYDVLRDGSMNADNIVKFVENGNSLKIKPSISDLFNYVQPLQLNPTNTDESVDGINIYSFALYPEEHQPSGTANLSRIDITTLVKMNRYGELKPILRSIHGLAEMDESIESFDDEFTRLI